MELTCDAFPGSDALRVSLEATSSTDGRASTGEVVGSQRGNDGNSSLGADRVDGVFDVVCEAVNQDRGTAI